MVGVLQDLVQMHLDPGHRQHAPREGPNARGDSARTEASRFQHSRSHMDQEAQVEEVRRELKIAGERDEPRGDHRVKKL
eukprot:6752176-Pyramimonas_sp.AAC.1